MAHKSIIDTNIATYHEDSQEQDASQSEPAEQSANQTSTDPSTVSMPPAEGRTDIGEEQAGSQQAPEEQAAGSTTAATQPQLLSKQPSEGREDTAQDLAQEQQQAYSASARQASNSPAEKEAGAPSNPQQSQAPSTKPED